MKVTHAPTSQAEARKAARERIARVKAGRRAARIAAPVAFAGTPDAHRLDANPNRSKRHASRANLNLRTDPSTAGRERLTRNTGRRRHGEVTRTPYLETTWRGTPNLPGILSKRPLKGSSRG